MPPPFGELWLEIATLLNDAVVKGGNDWADVETALETGHAQLWLTIADKPINATVTRMDGTTLEVWLCGGSVLAGSLHYLETILAAAKGDGATDARIVGRKGWLRVLKPYGWQQIGDELVKDLAA